MAALLFDGVDDRLRWTSLASALANVSDGAWTAAALLKGVSMTTGSDFDAVMYLLAGAGNGTTEAGFSFNSSDNLIPDIDGSSPPASGTALVDGQVYICVAKKAAGTVRPTLDWINGSAGTWSHAAPAGGGTLPDQSAATMFDIGVWEATGDPFGGYIGLAGLWEGVMTNLQVEALSTNWRTSDWWSHAFGAPKFLAELNVVAASVVDLAGNASTTSHVGTTLDAGETLNSWNFNGTGGGSSVAFAASVAGSAAVASSMVVTEAFAAAVAGTASVADALSVSKAFQASPAGMAAIAVDLSRAETFQAAVTGSAAVQAAVGDAVAFAAAVAGAGTVAADMATTDGSVVETPGVPVDMAVWIGAVW